jgi:hypothetical protein
MRKKEETEQREEADQELLPAHSKAHPFDSDIGILCRDEAKSFAFSACGPAFAGGFCPPTKLIGA